MENQLTIKEVEKLRLYELNSTLRNSNKFNTIDENGKNILHSINAYLSALIYNKGAKRKEILDVIKQTSPNELFSVKEGKNLDDPIMVYINLGEPISGILFEATKFFDGIENKPKIVPNMCFDNCLGVLKFCAENGIYDCVVLSGIDSNLSNKTNQNVLHSVVLIGNIVLDFNSNMAISDSLYFTLFDFETLSIVSVQDLLKNQDIISNDEIEKDSMFINFAFDDYMNWLRNKERQKREPISIDIKEIEMYLKYLAKKE